MFSKRYGEGERERGKGGGGGGADTERESELYKLYTHYTFVFQ